MTSEADRRKMMLSAGHWSCKPRTTTQDEGEAAAAAVVVAASKQQLAASAAATAKATAINYVAVTAAETGSGHSSRQQQLRT